MENNQSSSIDPQKKEESIFTGEDFSLQVYDKRIRQARNAIFIAAGVLGINLIILMFTVPEGYEYLWVDLSIWGIFILGFIALGFWTKKKPYYAIIGALVLYGLFITLNALLDISTLFKGIILKIIIISLLIKGLKDAKDAQEMKEHIGDQ